MTTFKSIEGTVIFARSESTYLAGAAMTGSTHAIEIVEEFPQFTLNYAFDGSRGGAAYSRGQYSRAAKFGRTTEGTIKLVGRGLGAAYTTASVPANLHPFILASGFSGSCESGEWIYKPTPINTQPTSLAMEIYTANEKWNCSGSYANLTIDGTDASKTHWEFAVQGMLGIPEDLVSLPLHDIQAGDVAIPTNSDIDFTVDGYSGSVVTSWRYEHGLELTPRMNLNSPNAHQGFIAGRHNHKLMVTIERPTFTDFDAYDSYTSSSLATVSLTVGTVANNRFTIQLNKAQITALTPAADGTKAVLELEFMGSVQTPTDTDVQITFN